MVIFSRPMIRLRWQIRAGVWSLFLKHCNRSIARLEPAQDGLYYLVIGERSRAGPMSRQRALLLGPERARSRLAHHPRGA